MSCGDFNTDLIQAAVAGSYEARDQWYLRHHGFVSSVLAQVDAEGLYSGEAYLAYVAALRLFEGATHEDFLPYLSRAIRNAVVRARLRDKYDRWARVPSISEQHMRSYNTRVRETPSDALPSGLFGRYGLPTSRMADEENEAVAVATSSLKDARYAALRMRFSGKTLEQIAYVLGNVSQERARQTANSAVADAGRNCRRNGLTSGAL